MLVAQCILGMMLAYLVVGVVFAVAFVTIGVQRVDIAARDTSVGFRLLIMPGSVALWPYLAARWIRASREEERKS
jgi:hypothetical protein